MKQSWCEFGAYSVTIVYGLELMSLVIIMYLPPSLRNVSLGWKEREFLMASRTPPFLWFGVQAIYIYIRVVFMQTLRSVI